MSSCTHKITKGAYTDYQWAFDHEDQVWISKWIESKDESTTVDIDTHRYKCTQCGKIMYYSCKARAHFENGVSFPGITGLE